MANKSIKQYNETTTTQTGSTTADKDAVLMQRGNDYFWIDPVNVRLGVQKAELTLTAGQVKALFSSPQEIVPAPGAGKYIIPLNIAYAKRFAGTAYTTNTTVRTQFPSSGAGNYIHTWNSLLGGTADLLKIGDYANADNEEIYENEKLNIYCDTSDPATGTGSVTFVVYYIIAEI